MMTRTNLATLAAPLLACLLNAFLPAARAEDGPRKKEIEAVFAKSDRIVLYSDRELTREEGEFKGASLFPRPVEVDEETELGAISFRVKDKLYWARGDDLRIKRPVSAKCLTVSRPVVMAGSRNANEGCLKPVLAGKAAPPPGQKP